MSKPERWPEYWNIFDLLQIEVHQGTMKLIPICGKCLSNIEILVKKSTYRQKADFKNFNFWSKSQDQKSHFSTSKFRYAFHLFFQNSAAMGAAYRAFYGVQSNGSFHSATGHAGHLSKIAAPNEGRALHYEKMMSYYKQAEMKILNLN